MAILLTMSDVQKVLDMKSTIEILEKGFSELAAGQAVMPQRTPIRVEEAPGLALFMPAYLPGMKALGAKVVSVYGKNPAEHNLPAVLGTIILLDAATGEPLCLMEGGFLTAMRTGGVSGVATKHLARRDSKVHALLGTGVQARAQAWAVAEAANLDKCLVWSVDTPDKQQAFAEEVAALTGVGTAVAASAEDAVKSCDILTLATSAKDPIVDGNWLKPGTHINGIGSHAPAMRELDTVSVQRSKVVCDLTSACRAEAGDFIIPAETGEWSWDSVHGDLGQVVRGEIAGRESDDEITLFKSVGLAIQDMSTAWQVYNLAKEKGVGTEFAFR